MNKSIKDSIFILLSLIIVLSTNSCTQAESQKSNLAYNVLFESSDVGDVRFDIDLKLDSGKISGGSVFKGYYDCFNFIDLLKINHFAGVKNKRLIYIEGVYEKDNNGIKFRTIFYSPIGNYYFDGRIENNKIEGKLSTKQGTIKGIINGIEKQGITNKDNYQINSNLLITTFEKNFFNPNFLTTLKYKKFKKKIISYTSLAPDDLHFVFSTFYYMRNLPYSHIGLWRKLENEEGIEKTNTQSKEIFKYTRKGENAILTIKSFTSERGELENQMIEILNDNPKNLIIDLRNNPGGNIAPALELCKYLITSPRSGGYFLTQKYYNQKDRSIKECYEFSEGDLDMFMHALKNNACVEVKLQPKDNTLESKVYILINQYSASTCEPIIYALKKEKNITLVGRNSAGKMLSAKEFKLRDNFYLYVPVADYITTENKRLDQVGVKPDIETKSDALEYVLNLLK